MWELSDETHLNVMNKATAYLVAIQFSKIISISFQGVYQSCELSCNISYKI